VGVTLYAKLAHVPGIFTTPLSTIFLEVTFHLCTSFLPTAISLPSIWHSYAIYACFTPITNPSSLSLSISFQVPSIFLEHLQHWVGQAKHTLKDKEQERLLECSHWRWFHLSILIARGILLHAGALEERPEGYRGHYRREEGGTCTNPGFPSLHQPHCHAHYTISFPAATRSEWDGFIIFLAAEISSEWVGLKEQKWQFTSISR
jgi:hypothetical protein